MAVVSRVHSTERIQGARFFYRVLYIHFLSFLTCDRSNPRTSFIQLCLDGTALKGVQEKKTVNMDLTDSFIIQVNANPLLQTSARFASHLVTSTPT